eukprot:PhM_4_TR673/c0_g1_i1/m.52472/K15272/SLC35A1_2_3; solute carrier family 35 (UDP-sugar transporter), member A1/2/3
MGEVTYTQKLIALLSLWAVSTCIGFTFKISQVKGRYNYNPASAVVMTELFKLVSSIVVAATVVMREMRDVPAPSSITVTSFWESYKTFYASSLSRELVGHTLGLAVSYAVVNNVSFAIFIHAPASSFFLLKAASPVITAVMLRVMVSRQISVVQWVSIIMQMGALVLTQYNGCTRSSELTFLAYFLIIVNVAVSCAAGVWNEHIVKTCGGSVNVLNTVLYCWGILVNLILYVLLPPSWIGGGATLGFFDGYSWAVWGVICANGVLGLVITAVYKYADDEHRFHVCARIHGGAARKHSDAQQPCRCRSCLLRLVRLYCAGACTGTRRKAAEPSAAARGREREYEI